ncbi:MAG: FeoA domain-containing protein [Acidilobaceae archaeon]
MPLSVARAGSVNVTIREVKVDDELKFRLYYMGLFPGASIRIIRNDGFSPVIVEVQESLIAISRDTADSILVEVEEMW